MWHVTRDTWHMTPTQPHPHIWGDVKKTSPMKGKVFFTGDRQTYTRTSQLYDWIGRFSENPSLFKPFSIFLIIFAKTTKRVRGSSYLVGKLTITKFELTSYKVVAKHYLMIFLFVWFLIYGQMNMPEPTEGVNK